MGTLLQSQGKQSRWREKEMYSFDLTGEGKLKTFWFHSLAYAPAHAHTHTHTHVWKNTNTQGRDKLHL